MVAASTVAFAFGDSRDHEDRPTDSKSLERMNQVLTQLVLQHMPHEYSNEKKWGLQKKRWDGVKWERDGWRLETRRRWKMVNHGTWKRYSARLSDPDRMFEVNVSNLRNTDDGATAFDVAVDADLELDARQAEWVKGVQLYSVGAEGTARVRLQLSCESRLKLEMSDSIPVLKFSPRVISAKLQVVDFRIHRVSKLGGEVAQAATRMARQELDRKIEEHETRLVEKINRELKKHEDDLALSLSAAINNRWIRQAAPTFPPEIRSAVDSADNDD